MQEKVKILHSNKYFMYNINYLSNNNGYRYYTHSLPLLNSCLLLSTEKRCNVANHQGNNINVSMEATPAANGL